MHYSKDLHKIYNLLDGYVEKIRRLHINRY